MNYSSYLRSKVWKEKRKEALEFAKGKCQLCNSNKKLHVHHRTYERIGNEDLSDLIVLCENCHGKFHDKVKSVAPLKIKRQIECSRKKIKANDRKLSKLNNHLKIIELLKENQSLMHQEYEIRKQYYFN